MTKMAQYRDVILARQRWWRKPNAARTKEMREGPPQDFLDAIAHAANYYGLDLEQYPTDALVLLCVLVDVLHRKQTPWIAKKEGRLRKRGGQIKWDDGAKVKLERRLKALGYSGKTRRQVGGTDRIVQRLKKDFPEDYGHLKKDSLIRRLPRNGNK